MRYTSIIAYDEIKRSNKDANQRDYLRWVLERMREATRSELADATGIPLSAICGRVHEMIACGEFEELPRRACSITGKQAHPVTIKRKETLQ